jgi:hypothetical protein
MKATQNPPRPQSSTPDPKDLPYRLRRSRIHGQGAFATRAIKKGERIVEYVGERISHTEADRRHLKKADDDGHTFLFTIDDKTVIDAGVGGNSSRFINHSCDPNCEVIIDRRRIYVEAIRPIAAGEELAYDYRIGRSDDDPPGMEEVFGCRCETAACRGTMLAPLEDEEEEAPISERRQKNARDVAGAPSSGSRGSRAAGSTGGERGSRGSSRGTRSTSERGARVPAKRTKGPRSTKAAPPTRRRRAG